MQSRKEYVMKIFGKHLSDVEEGMSLIDQEEVEKLVELLKVVKKQ
jgi:D-sedoheptulose 7-phosphate isomerase